MTETELKHWVIGRSEWAQHINPQRFELTRFDDADLKPDGMVHKISGIVGARVHETNCDSFICAKSHYPPEFEYCPFCGSKLSDTSDSEGWVPPYGAGTGIRFFERTTLPLKTTAETAKVFPLPTEHGDFQFIVAKMGTHSPVLICFNRMSGKVSVFNPLKSEWLPFKEKKPWVFGENQLPEWSWSAGVIAENQLPGFAVPSALGPVWMEIDWHVGTVTPKVGSGECLGGVGVLGGKAYVPVENDRKISIHCFDPKSGHWEPLYDVPVTVQDTKNFFSVPIIDEQRQSIFWIGTQGLLKCTRPDFAIHSAVLWRPWKADTDTCRAIPELGPPFRDNLGKYWQICYDDRDEAYSYFNLTDNEGDEQEVDGGRFSSGLVSFGKPFEYWAHPWEKRDESRDDRSHQFRVPLLTLDPKSQATVTACFGQNINDPIKKVLTNKKKKFVTTLCIESRDGLLLCLSMDQALNCSRPWELRAFVYRNEWVVYLPEEGACWSWKLW